MTSQATTVNDRRQMPKKKGGRKIWNAFAENPQKATYTMRHMPGAGPEDLRRKFISPVSSRVVRSLFLANPRAALSSPPLSLVESKD